jgi:hypothetical protein
MSLYISSSHTDSGVDILKIINNLINLNHPPLLAPPFNRKFCTVFLTNHALLSGRRIASDHLRRPYQLRLAFPVQNYSLLALRLARSAAAIYLFLPVCVR